MNSKEATACMDRFEFVREKATNVTLNDRAVVEKYALGLTVGGAFYILNALVFLTKHIVRIANSIVLYQQENKQSVSD